MSTLIVPPSRGETEKHEPIGSLFLRQCPDCTWRASAMSDKETVKAMAEHIRLTRHVIGQDK